MTPEVCSICRSEDATCRLVRDRFAQGQRSADLARAVKLPYGTCVHILRAHGLLQTAAPTRTDQQANADMRHMVMAGKQWLDATGGTVDELLQRLRLLLTTPEQIEEHLTETQRRRLDLFRSGASITEIARGEGVDRTVIYETLAYCGVEKFRKYRRLPAGRERQGPRDAEQYPGPARRVIAKRRISSAPPGAYVYRTSKLYNTCKLTFNRACVDIIDDIALGAKEITITAQPSGVLIVRAHGETRLLLDGTSGFYRIGFTSIAKSLGVDHGTRYVASREGDTLVLTPSVIIARDRTRDEKRCRKCEQPFLPAWTAQRYCQACAPQPYIKEETVTHCEICGNSFTTSKVKRGKYCSDACRYERLKQRQKENYQKRKGMTTP